MKKSFFCGLMSVVLLSAISCSGGRSNMTEEYLPAFVQSHFTKPSSTLSAEVDLFVDYSTCVATASTSEFYNATHPAIVDCNPNFYSIKGKYIKFETNNREEVYTLLRTIKEVNNADLKQAVHQIVNGNRQAVIITDGEYFPNNIVADNLNNPYLAPEFRTWLKKGLDIYIYSEPYIESNRFNKYRYYIIFTDDKMEDNLNEKFSRNAPDASGVLVLHLTADAPKLDKKSKLVFNEIFTPTKLADDIYAIDLSWRDMENLLKDAEADFIFRGLKVEMKAEDVYKVDDVEPVVYQLYPPYMEYVDSLELSNKKILADVSSLRELDDVFEIDERVFKKSGEIVLKLDEEFYETLSDEHENVLRVDFVVDEAVDNFTRNDELNCGFKWASIARSNGHALNTSVYQSISQVVSEPSMNPGRNKKVIATVYLYTSQY